MQKTNGNPQRTNSRRKVPSRESITLFSRTNFQEWKSLNVCMYECRPYSSGKLSLVDTSFISLSPIFFGHKTFSLLASPIYQDSFIWRGILHNGIVLGLSGQPKNYPICPGRLHRLLKNGMYDERMISESITSTRQIHYKNTLPQLPPFLIVSLLRMGG